MSKNQFTGTATQPQCNRTFCQFKKDQYCTEEDLDLLPKTMILYADGIVHFNTDPKVYKHYWNTIIDNGD